MYLNPYIPKSQASLHLCSVVASSVKRVQRERGVAFWHSATALPLLHPLDLGQLVLGFKGLRVEGFRGFRALGFRGFGV